MELQGFVVRGEVCQCDLVALRGKEMIGVELKLVFGLPVLYQALERLSSVDLVYVAVSAPLGNKARGNWDRQVPKAVRLCRRLGCGLIEVRDGLVTVLTEPGVYQPRQVPRRRLRMLKEFTQRSGDYNIGGTTKRPRVTVYRERALRCARELAQKGNMSPAALRQATGDNDMSSLLQNNVYDWFSRVSRGIYSITPKGTEALMVYGDVVRAQMDLDQALA